ncbi:NAD-dependent succinate-semialdehyde dehydrogenase [Candidatus Berkiella cookevillensis]|uniref:NAD-dependent succinate-semialdehyde dehydrogenase n=1 Tax=Candidatus Berkiella cookevillensis TaxID=437022 RepID=A0A0Q9Y9C8_9GAMM|nr:NAD-dependent succinate-semialdehyde dehydrogenase [Candidatus Berkiella cookevillensis]MCS5707772.1 NAD-dependent succinate-semialdehyde dehydrogenase [Candidatus Berkiella cookevillensis]
MKSISPVSAELICIFQAHTNAEIENAILNAHNAFKTWRNYSFEQRASCLKKAATILRDNAIEHATMISQEMGKSFKEALAEIEKCAVCCDYYAEHGATLLQNENISTAAQKSYISYQPLGVILSIMPWNFPYWQVFRFAAPTLMAGNTALLKHASNVSGCSVAIEKIFMDAGFLEHSFQSLLVKSADIEPIIAHPLVQAVTLTGSTQAGSSVAQLCGKYIKKSVLELGGSDPYLILEDADLESAAKLCVQSRTLNAGQSCIAAKRFLVMESVYEQFVSLFVDKMRAIRMGDPFSTQTHIGPMATHALRDELHKQVTRSIQLGANCLLGGELPDNVGAYYPATVLSNVKPGMPAFEEELFGPVASIIKVKTQKEAIEIANASHFGLGSAVFTKDIAKGQHIAEYELQYGNCFVNDFVRSDPRLPFGGIKQSGYGRELAHCGIREFCNIKTVYIQ